MQPGMIIVGMADLNVAASPGILTTIGLGSCVGVALYDGVKKIAGLAHIMLPDSKLIKNNSNAAKFADTAIVKLLGDMARIGARPEFVKAKIAGGAQMFAFDSTSDAMRIGDKNVEATRKVLAGLGIPIIAADTGATYGRTVEIHAEDGQFLIRTVGHGSRVL